MNVNEVVSVLTSKFYDCCGMRESSRPIGMDVKVLCVVDPFLSWTLTDPSFRIRGHIHVF